MRFAVVRRHTRKLALVAGWATLLFIVGSTLAPIYVRPTSSLPVDFERCLAFAIVGFAFTLASPNRPLLLLALLVACAGSLEWLQTLSPGRHARMDDFAVKAIGVAIGVATATVANYWVRRFGKSSAD